MERRYLCVRHEVLDQTKMLSDAETGRLFRAMLEYSKTGTAPELSGRESIIWPSMEADIVRQKEAYEEKCKKNASSARRRWQKNTPAGEGVSDANACERIRTHANAYKNKKEINTPYIPQGGNAAAAMENPDFAMVAQAWNQDIGTLSRSAADSIVSWLQIAESGMICAVIRYAALAGKRDGRYVDRVIRNAVDRNITTLADWDAEQRAKRRGTERPAEPEEHRRWL